jgi:hypothetical protein
MLDINANIEFSAKWIPVHILRGMSALAFGLENEIHLRPAPNM